MSREKMPRCDFIFHVGFSGAVGIQPDRRADVEQKIHATLESIRTIAARFADKNLHASEAITMRLITCLAGEGDRLAAQIARDALRYETHFCLPSGRNLPTHATADQQPLTQSSAAFELAVDDPIHQSRDQAVRIMLGHSDLLVALCDGEPDPAAPDGRVDAILRARKAGIPVIAISLVAGRQAKIVHHGVERPFTEPELEEKLKEILGVYPGDRADAAEPSRKALERYLAEQRRTVNFAILYKLLFRLLSPGPKPGKPAFNIALEDYDAAASRELGLASDGAPAGATEQPWIPRLRTHFGWSDNLAIFYADIFRSMIVLRHTLVLLTTLGLAVGFYWGFWLPDQKLGFIRIAGFALQFLGVSGILGLMVYSRKREWQRRFMDYRILAEMLRLLRYLYPLGIVFSGIHAPVDHKYSFTWINYQFRSVLRSLGAPHLFMDREALRASLGQFLSGIDGQILFHAKNEARCAGAAAILNSAWRILFGAGLCMIAIRIVAQYFFSGDSVEQYWFKTYCNMLALILPALGAYAYALLTGLGFERLRDRSRAMVGQLRQNGDEIRALLERIERGDGSVGYEDVRLIAQNGIKTTVLEELTDWRILVNSKSITIY